MSAGCTGPLRLSQEQECPKAWGIFGRDVALKREIQAFARMARETMALVE
jgi:hypothetical protein